ncbi:hypothetical protein B0H14DRAFT_3136134 [Mycena olivaceomarginata]|nr:hypothetical protein B0H14DRAFT_3136134 [Mycena olivaceomarginata]
MRPEHIETFFLLPPGSARLALRALHSLFYIPPMFTRFGVPDNVYPLHASFGDYLGDPRRSGRWCVSTAWLHSDFLHCALRLLSTPPSTVDTRNFHLNVVGGLPRLLSYVTPCNTLINLLRHEQVQNTIFSRFGDSESWPKGGSGYPRDLIQLWEDHQFISELVDCSVDRSPTPNKAPPTYKFDAIYREILRQSPELLFLLRPTVIHEDLKGVMFCLGPQHNFRVFQPFLKIRGLLTSPLKPGDLPVAFLADPHRAGNLYLDPQDISEDVALLWIRIAKTRLMEGSLDFTSYSSLLTDCQPSSRILHELESLDLGQICDPRNINPVDHYQAHTRIFSNPRSDDAVLDWLWRFPDPPLHAIAFWEKQRATINQCALKGDVRGTPASAASAPSHPSSAPPAPSPPPSVHLSSAPPPALVTPAPSSRSRWHVLCNQARDYCRSLRTRATG